MHQPYFSGLSILWPIIFGFLIELFLGADFYKINLNYGVLLRGFNANVMSSEIESYQEVQMMMGIPP